MGSRNSDSTNLAAELRPFSTKTWRNLNRAQRPRARGHTQMTARRHRERGRRSASILTFVQIGGGNAGQRIGPVPLLLWTTESRNTGGRRSRAAGSRDCVSRARRRRPTPDTRQSCASRATGGCRGKRAKSPLAASLWMLANESDVDPARVPQATGAPIRRHRRRDRNRLDGVADQPSPSR
jgi:hypothetical protein